MAAKFSDLVAYFKLLAQKHVAIQHTDTEKHFYRFELDEVLSGLKDINYPALILEGYRFNYKDNRSDNQMKTRDGAFILLGHLSDVNDFDAIHQLWDDLEAIGDDLVAKIKADKRNMATKAVKDFNVESVEGNLIANDMDKNFGIRFTFSISSPAPMDVDPTKWIE